MPTMAAAPSAGTSTSIPGTSGAAAAGGPSSSSSTATTASPSRPAPLQTVTPPPHFAIVEDAVYRSAYPTTAHGRYLQTLGLRTVIALSVEAVPMQVGRMLEHQGATIVHLGEHSWAERNDFAAEMIAQALQVILDADNHPVLLMCATGQLQTTAVVGALRRMLGWALTSIGSEIELFAPAGVRRHRHAILEAVESFDAVSLFASLVKPRLITQRAALEAANQWRDAYEESASPTALAQPPATEVDQAALQKPSASAAKDDDVGSGAVSRQSTTRLGDAPEVSNNSLVQTEASVAAGALVDRDFDPALAAPLPLWFLQNLRHTLALTRAVEEDAKPTSSPEPSSVRKASTGSGGPPVTPDAHDTSVAATIRRQQLAILASSGQAPPTSHQHRQPPHEVYRCARLAPLISDRNGYNKADSLVDSDDD